MSGDTLHVHLKGEFSSENLSLMQSLLGDQVRITSGDLPDSEDVSVLVGGIFTSEDIVKYPLLTSIIIPWAGVPAATLEAVRKHPHVSLHNIHHNAVSASEMALTLMLAAAKLIIPADQALRQNDWTPRYRPEGLIIADSRVLVVGWGSIGQLIGKACSAMGASVKGISRAGRGDTLPVERLHSLLPETDILFLSVPSTESTIGLIGESELALLPDNSVLVNISRGNVVDEQALYLALKNGELGAAGLDVWYSYPRSVEGRTDTKPSSFAFGELPNVVMSPHRGGAFGLLSQEERRIRELAVVIDSIVSGKSDKSKVDLEMGY